MKSKLLLIISSLAILMALGFTKSYAQYDISATASSPVIDGTIDDLWNSEPRYVGVDPTTWTPTPDHTSLDDCSFTWSAVWDADSLYILVVVKDDIVTTGVEGSDVYSWMNDNVEITINDPTGNTDPAFFRYAFDRDGEDTGLDDDPPKNTPVGSHFATSTSDDGWIMEAAIPYDIIGFTSTDLTAITNISVADLDDPEATAWDQLSGHVQWPSGWATGNITLTATAAIDDVAPGQVTQLAGGNIKFNSVDLTWLVPADDDITGYLIMVDGAPKAYAADKMTTGITIEGLTAETTYTVSVITTDPQNLSEAVSIEVTTGANLKPMDIDIGAYEGAYSDPFEDFDYWEGLLPIPINYLKGDDKVDDMDIAGNMKLAWTMVALYMQFNVTDESLVNADEGAPWNNDAVEYHFDMGGERDGSSTENAFDNWDPNNFQYRAIPYQTWQTGSTPAPIWTDVSYATYDYYGDGVDAIGYTIEIKFPWAALNASADMNFVPAEGETVSFDPKIIDKDADASSHTLSWSSFSHDEQYKNDAEFGLVHLEGEPSGINSNALGDMVQILPNPASDYVNITIAENFSGSIMINDLSGKLIMNEYVDFSGTKTISLSNFAEGMYLVTLINAENEMYRTKLVVK